MIHPTHLLIVFKRKSHCERAERVRQSPPEVPGFSREIAAVAPLPRDDLGRLLSNSKPELIESPSSELVC